MFDFSHCYHRFPDELATSRLDALYNDPIFDVIEERIAAGRFPFQSLSEAATFLAEGRDPQANPHDEFAYVDIGSIDTVRGVPSPEIMLGHQATSSRMRRVMHEGNVLVSSTRPTRNAICVVPDKLDDQICSTGFAVLECKPDVLSRFLFYALRSDVASLQFERLCSGSGYPAINQETDLPQVRVPKPNVETQREILKALEPMEVTARRLDEQGAKIREDADKILLAELGIHILPADTANYFFKTGSEKQTVWFFVFPDDVTNRLHYLFFHPRHQVLDVLCARYCTVPLTRICREPIVRGEQPDYDEFGTVSVLKTVDLRNDCIDYDNTSKVSEDFFAAHPAAHVRKGDILIASTGYVSMGKVDVYDDDEPAMADGHISIVRVNENYDPYFVAYFLRCHLGQQQFEKWFTGSSGQIEVQPMDLGEFLVPVSDALGVPLGEQQRVATAITKRLDEARALEQQAAAKWSEAKDSFEERVGC